MCPDLLHTDTLIFVHTLPSFQWFRCSISLSASALPTGKSAHPLSVFEAIIKGITEEAQLQDRLQVCFCWKKQRASHMRIKFEKPIILQVDLFGGDLSEAEQWLVCALRYFDEDGRGRNFSIACESSVECMKFESFFTSRSITHSKELCLDFETPLPFQTVRGKPRFWLNSEGFKKSLQQRLKKLFSHTPKLPETDFEVLPFYWSYYQISHQSNSQSGHIKYLNGCLGRLYIKSDTPVLQEWLPWLQLAEEIGLGGKTSFGLGRFSLLLESPPYFDPGLINPVSVQHAIHGVLERYDEALPVLANNPSGIDEHQLAYKLVDEIKEGWQPLAYQAFSIPKSSGGMRIVEKAHFRELVLQQHILSLLRDVLDSTFEEESIGFRKGVSRESAVERLNKALAEGYDYVLESDIADFFPSVHLGLLQGILDQVLPNADVLLRKTISSILLTPRELLGQLELREGGLAAGSPLSPLLANLYLDAFDERIKAHGVRLIRFADDFIILTKGYETAQALLGFADDYLKDLGLLLNLEKTAIRPIREGFVFLGIKFSGEMGSFQKNTAPQSVRKPVYITEPYVFLGVSSACLEIRQHATVLASIPLKRISEILMLAPCNWSSQLLMQCVKENIPLVVTAGNGRHIATLGGDRAQHYEVAFKQTQKFHSMGEVGQLILAKSFASGKLRNYSSLIRQRYQAGTNRILTDIESISKNMWDAPDLPTLRGLEGIAARHTFKLFGGWIESDDFKWQGRIRRPPDRINSLLNFCYHLLFCRINVLLRGEGLNPFLGFLHEPTDRYEVLVCDIQELFRANIDRFVVRLINLGILSASDFIKNDYGHWLNGEGKKRVLAEFAKELDQVPLAKERTTLNEALALQVRSIKLFFLEDSDIQFYKW